MAEVRLRFAADGPGSSEEWAANEDAGGGLTRVEDDDDYGDGRQAKESFRKIVVSAEVGRDGSR